MDIRIGVPYISVIVGTLAAVLAVSCNDNSQQTPMAFPTPEPLTTATHPPIQGVDPDQTPLPPIATRSALVDIRERGELRVGVLYNYAPFSSLNHDGQVVGYEVELVRRIAEKWGVGTTFVQVTRQTRLPMLHDGEVDLIAGAVPHRRELESMLEFSDTIFRSGYVILVLSASGIQTASQVGGGPVGIVGPEAERAFAEYAAQHSISPGVQAFSDVTNATAALMQGSVTAVVGRRETLMLASISTPESAILNEFVQVEPYALAVRRGDTPLRDLINLTLQEVFVDSTFVQLFNESFYGYAADLFPILLGEPVYSFQTFPTNIDATASLIERIRRGEPVRVAGMALNAEAGPFDGQPIVDGYNRAVINEMARRWNVPVAEIPDSAGSAGLNLLQSGQADLVVGIRPDRSMFGALTFTQPYYTRGIRLMHLADVPLFGVGDLEFKDAIAAPPVDVTQDLIDDNNSAPRIQAVESYQQAFDTLISRGVYAVVGDEFSLFLMAQADARLTLFDQRYRPVSYVMALPSADVDFQALVNFTLQDMAADGTLAQLSQQYFAPYLPPSEELEPLNVELWPGDGSFLGFGQ